MNQISRHISYLLLSCRNVMIPGLGLFMVSKERASFDSVFGVFYPSKIRIKFYPNEEISSMGSEVHSLSDSLARKLKISFEEADTLVEDYVYGIFKQVSANHYCRLEGIGYLIENKGRLLFKDTFWKKLNHSPLSSVKVS